MGPFRKATKESKTHEFSSSIFGFLQASVARKMVNILGVTFVFVGVVMTTKYPMVVPPIVG